LGGKTWAKYRLKEKNPSTENQTREKNAVFQGLMNTSNLGEVTPGRGGGNPQKKTGETEKKRSWQNPRAGTLPNYSLKGATQGQETESLDKE